MITLTLYGGSRIHIVASHIVSIRDSPTLHSGRTAREVTLSNGNTWSVAETASEIAEAMGYNL